jgi:hypothetical protein
MMELLKAWKYSRLLDQCRSEADAPPAPPGPRSAQAFVHDALRMPSLAPRTRAPDGLVRAIAERVVDVPCAASTAPGPFERVLRPVAASALLLGLVGVTLFASNGQWRAQAPVSDASGFGGQTIQSLLNANPSKVAAAADQPYQQELDAIREDTQRAARTLFSALPLGANRQDQAE